jgi:hypothetical protein
MRNKKKADAVAEARAEAALARQWLVDLAKRLDVHFSDDHMTAIHLGVLAQRADEALRALKLVRTLQAFTSTLGAEAPAAGKTPAARRRRPVSTRRAAARR